MWNLSFDAISYRNWSCRRLQTRKKLGCQIWRQILLPQCPCHFFIFFIASRLLIWSWFSGLNFILLWNLYLIYSTISKSKYERFKRNSKFDWSPSETILLKSPSETILLKTVLHWKSIEMELNGFPAKYYFK